ncbi:MAG TPA: hypothetical protein ENI98_06280 [Gammaproteobacteria bacterium]|nr:hypothetical protein [Gammaproteobacteria bacterium]
MNNKNINQDGRLLRLTAIPAVLAIILSGCGGGGGGDDTANGDNNTDTQVVDCSKTTEGCSSDLDADGLSFLQEQNGWDALGHHVTSDHDKADTDNDGLDDYEEFLAKTDPRNSDTDNDGLTDGEEIHRWKTNPLSIDSDGDSKGSNGDLEQNSALFDGAELNIDFANDPSHTPGPGATSPILADTDGDGWNDYYEMIETQGKGFNPVIADVPHTRIEIASSPVIRLTGTYESGTAWVKDVSVTDSLSQSVSTDATVSRSTELTIEATTGVGAELGFEAGTEGGKVTGNISASFSLSTAMASAQSISWSHGQASAAEKVYQESRSRSGSEAITLSGGYLSLPINLSNNGNISYTLTDLRINVLARYMNGTGDYVPVMELKREDNIPVTLSPGQTYSNILMKSYTKDYELIRSFLKNPSGLMFEVSSYSMVDKDGVSFGFSEETIKQKTALVVIDYGGEHPPEYLLVATSPHRSPDQNDGVSMATVMKNILDIPYQTSDVSTDSGSSYKALSGVRDVLNDASLHKKWLVATNVAGDNSNSSGFGSTRINAGDSVYLIFVKDEDSDGLSAREEFLQGTSDQLVDTDSDGLTDFEEIRQGWSVKVEGELAYNALSRGYNADSDSDGLPDKLERSCGLDPVKADTDQDGISDYDELYGYDISQNGLLVQHIFPYTGSVILDGGNGLIESSVSGDDDLLAGAMNSSVDRGGVIMGAGADGLLDSIPGGDDYIAVTHDMPNCLAGGFASNPLSRDTDGDSVPDNLERELALGSPNNPNDFNEYLDTDGDGLSDAFEVRGFSSRVNGAWVQFVSDPNSADSDSDGLPDLLEYLLGSNPQSRDTDADKLLDFDEYDFVRQWNEFEARCNRATNCSVPPSKGKKYGTSINRSDTDGDGLDDGAEIAGWTVKVGGKSPYHVTSNPLLTNEDLDGWNDFSEYTARTDPKKADTDDDGTADDVEVGIWASYGGTQWAISAKHRDPLVADKRITLKFIGISAGADDCELFGPPWYNFGFMFTLPDGSKIQGPGTVNYCSSTHCDYIAVSSGYLHLNAVPEGSFPFIMNASNASFNIDGVLQEIDPPNLFNLFCLGASSCAKVSWQNIGDTYQTESLTSDKTVIFTGGPGCLGDDRIELRIKVD